MKANLNKLLPFFILICVSFLAGPLQADTDMFRMRPKANEKYPEFHVGVTGLKVEIRKGLVVTVTGAMNSSPAAGKFKNGDVLLAVNGKTLVKAKDARVVLGDAITEAEALDGKMVFAIKRKEAKQKVVVSIPVMGAYSETWPLNCEKSKKIIKQTADYIVRCGMLENPKVLALNKSLAALFLLSTGDDAYLPPCKKHLAFYSSEKSNGSTWHDGYAGVFLGEYYLRTGDKAAIPALKVICDTAVRGQYNGAWAHSTLSTNPGYVQGGHMNPAGAQIVTTWILARECGLAVHPKAFNRGLRFFYRFAGHGAVPYGDHRTEGGLSSNGKNGMLVCMLSLLDGPNYQNAARHMAMYVADSYFEHLAGHTGGGFDAIWRGMAASHVPKDRQSKYRRCMDNLRWFYDLSRLPGGGFAMCGGEYTGPAWGSGGLGMAYTAPLRKLRILGGPRTKFSRPVQVPDREWGNPADDIFLSTEHCKGFGESKLQPHEIRAELDRIKVIKNQSEKEFCIQMMRHFNYIFRLRAATILGQSGEIEQMVAALQDPDARVRRAALDGISAYNLWWGGGKGGTYTPEQVSDNFLQYILRPLQDSKASLYEVDGALNALGFAKAEDVAKCFDAVKPFMSHEYWWLREASWRSLRGILNDEKLLKPVLPVLAENFGVENHVMPRRVYYGLLKKQVLDSKKMSDEIKKMTIDAMVATMKNVEMPSAMNMKVVVANNTYETLRGLNLKKYPAAGIEAFKGIEHVAGPELGKYLLWSFCGDAWGNAGMLYCVEKLGKEAGPLIAIMKRLLPQVEKWPTKARYGDVARKVEKRAKELITKYESQYGKVSI